MIRLELRDPPEQDEGRDIVGDVIACAAILLTTAAALLAMLWAVWQVAP